MKKILLLLLLIIAVSGCRISYTFRSASINYDLTPSLSIAHFMNQAPLVYPPLEQRFNEAIQDVFTRNTRLQIIPNNATMELEGEIIGYQLTPLAVQADAFASETRLTMTVRFRFRNNVQDVPEISETISANQVFDSRQSLEQVQDALLELMIKEITDQIFNVTMTNW